MLVMEAIKVFLLVTKHKPEAIEEQGELQNDGSLSLVAPKASRGEKRENWNSRVENLHQNAKSAKVSDTGLTTILL